MRKIRTKKIKNQTNKYLLGPFDDSLVQIMLDKNEKCLQQTSKSNFEKVSELLSQIKTDQDMISSYNREKYIIQSLFHNTEAYFHQKQNQYDQALKCLESAESIQKEQNLGPIEMARTKLNQSVILSHLDRRDEAILLGKEALALLKSKSEWQEFQLQKNQYKLYEIMTLSFYNIASELSHLKDNQQAIKVYKEGYYLAQRTLGLTHKLTLLLKSIIKDHRQTSKSKEKTQIQQLKSNRSQINEGKQVINLLLTDKEKELKRIYASKRKVHSTSQRQGPAQKQMRYYLKSLEKIKGMYTKTREQKKWRMGTVDSSERRSNWTRSNGLATEERVSRRYDQFEHQKIKDILLNGRRINQNKIYGKQRSKTENLPEIPLQKINNTIFSTFQPLKVSSDPPKEQNPLTFTEIVEKIDEKSKEKESECQLI